MPKRPQTHATDIDQGDDRSPDGPMDDLVYRWADLSQSMRGPDGGWLAHRNELHSRHVQFGIRHLIWWTTLAAVLMGLVRAVNGSEGPFSAYWLVIVFNILVAFPALIGPLLRRGAVKTLAAAAIAVALGSWLESRLLGIDDFLFFLLTNGFQFLWAAGSMGILRARGYRLIRRAP